ncbi:UDP-N-acetylglucosamine 1-carboxyvinyltransferase [Kribbella sp. NPDC051587]|uniref:UDP-N-acetylglucosamine 1-carboxyvinyltransferase n=1 Tax=Kribbella sp. NPDC051587 TaxID=3364119 RepID=UPI0037A06758
MTLDLRTHPRTTLTVRSGRPLSGTVRVDGSKNAALPLLAAAAAVGRPVKLANVPRSTDVQLMAALLKQSGFAVARRKGHLEIKPNLLSVLVPDLPEAARIRASYYLVPALLAWYGTAQLPLPGGCRIGDRGMDLHFDVYRAFGDQVDSDIAGYRVRKSASTEPLTVRLPFRSRGASVCAVLRAVVGRQRLRLENPNLSPEFTGMLAALRTADYRIEVSPEAVTVVPPVYGSTTELTWDVPGDKIEAGTIAAAIAATGGTGRIEGVDSEGLMPMVAALNCLGIPAAAVNDALVIADTARPERSLLEAVATLDPDGLDADFEPALMALALSVPGTHVFADEINPGRHGNLLPQLARLGATIEELSPTRCRLTGPQQLTGTRVEATDIRTGSALLIAGLTAAGTTTITGLDQLRRGHPDLPGKLRWLGAEIAGDEQ